MNYKLKGNWAEGLAFDLHTLNSERVGENEYGYAKFNTTRSEMGELVYQLKYDHDSSVVKIKFNNGFINWIERWVKDIKPAEELSMF